MGIVVEFRHARTASRGYKSGRNSCLEIPVISSTAITLKGGTSSHCETACAEMPSAAANEPVPPAASIARRKAMLLSLIAGDLSIAFVKSQAVLNCAPKAILYDAAMTFGKRILAARDRLDLKQKDIAKFFKISPSAVSEWERDESKPEFEKLGPLARLLKVPVIWLLEGGGPPPDDDDLVALINRLTAPQRRQVMRLIQILMAEGEEAA